METVAGNRDQHSTQPEVIERPPRSAFFLFIEENVTEYYKKYPNLDEIEIKVMIANAYRKLPEEQRVKYENKAH